MDFDEDAEDISVEEEMPGPKRAVHGRKATAFVPKKATMSSNAGEPVKV